MFCFLSFLTMRFTGQTEKHKLPFSSRNYDNVQPVSWRKHGVCFPWPWTFVFCILRYKHHGHFDKLRWIWGSVVSTEILSSKLLNWQHGCKHSFGLGSVSFFQNDSPKQFRICHIPSLFWETIVWMWPGDSSWPQSQRMGPCTLVYRYWYNQTFLRTKQVIQVCLAAGGYLEDVCCLTLVS